jgi:prevent-host-death family protein
MGDVLSFLDYMTRCDYLMVMKKVKIAQLKARLSEHLRQVRRGETYTVMDRETPIARLLPYGAEAEPLRVRKPLRRVPTLQDVRLPPPLKTDVDPVALLLEERQVER